MSKAPQKRSAKFKLNLAIEALKGVRPLTEIASEYGIHPKQIRRWVDQLLDEGENIFIHKATQRATDPDKERLLHIINQLNSDLDFIKKN